MVFNEAMKACLEIEGLLTLLESREYKVPEEIIEVLNLKLSELQSQISTIQLISTSDVVIDAKETVVDSEVVESTLYEESEDADTSTTEVPQHTSPKEVDNQKCNECGNHTTAEDISKSEPILNDVLQPSDFSLNDMYRFRKELFNNSDEYFTETLSTLRIMTSVDEIKDYLFNDLCWDKSNPTVLDFLTIVTANKQ